VIGAGGMGEVYRAMDTKLGREVALKVLPAELAASPERLERFRREAKALAALDHPGIVTVYSVEEADGLHFLTMQLLEGQPLDRLIPEGGMPQDRLLAIAASLSDALAAAHEKGIVHRDLKPANVMVTKAGRVKVLDFGLAQVTASEEETARGSELSTAMRTRDGIVMGTVPYMSPEQVQGRAVDRRTDIFSLGVILYEMATGRRPFRADSAAGLMSAILRDEPEPAVRLRSGLAPALCRVIERCLAKDPKARFQTAADVEAALQGKPEAESGRVVEHRSDDLRKAGLAVGEPGHTLQTSALINQAYLRTDGSASAPATSSAEYLISEIKRHKRGVAAALATLAIATVAFVWFMLSIRQSTRTDRMPANRTLNRLTFDAGLQSEPTWSPDGRFIAYSSDRGGNSDIWVRQVGGGNPVQITNSPAHDWQPDWSPDGDNIVFRSERDGGGLFVVPVLGGHERKIASFGFRPRWSPDGSKILFQSSSFRFVTEIPKVYLATLDGSEPREALAGFLAEFTGEFGEFCVAWGPDSQRVSIWGLHRRMGRSFWTSSISGGSRIRSEVAPSVDQQIKDTSVTLNSFVWANTGRALYFEGTSGGVRNLWRVVVEPQTLRWVAGPERLTVGPGADAGSVLSADGKKLAFTTQTEVTRAWSLPFNALTGQTTGTGQALTPAGVILTTFDLSVDGDKLAYVTNRAGKHEVWKKTLADGQETLLRSADGFFISAHRWSPDGTRIAYRRSHPPDYKAQREYVVAVLSSTGGDEQLLTAPITSSEIPSGWSADGQWLLVSSTRYTRGLNLNQICRMPVTAAPHAETGMHVIASHPEYNLWQAQYSPNGRWIVFNAIKTSESGISTIYTVPASGGEWARITEGKYWDDKPRWAPDGRKLYFLSSRGGFLNVWGVRFDPLSGKAEGEPFRITDFQSPSQMVSPVIANSDIDVSAHRLLLTILEVSGSIWVLENVDR